MSTQTPVMGKVIGNRKIFPCHEKAGGLNTQIDYQWTSILRLMGLDGITLTYAHLEIDLIIVFFSPFLNPFE